MKLIQLAEKAAHDTLLQHYNQGLLYHAILTQKAYEVAGYASYTEWLNSCFIEPNTASEYKQVARVMLLNHRLATLEEKEDEDGLSYYQVSSLPPMLYQLNINHAWKLSIVFEDDLKGLNDFYEAHNHLQAGDLAVEVKKLYDAYKGIVPTVNAIQIPASDLFASFFDFTHSHDLPINGNTPLDVVIKKGRDRITIVAKYQ